MKRKLLKFLVLCLSLTILAGCGSEKPLEPVEEELLSRSDALFMVEVQDANHATVTFKNLEETYLYIGHESKLHMRRDGVWYNIPIIEDKRWPEYSRGLPPGGKEFKKWYLKSGTDPWSRVSTGSLSRFMEGATQCTCSQNL